MPATSLPVPSNPGSMYPGDKGLLLGQRAVPGFFGNIASGVADLANDNASTLAASGVSRTMAIAAFTGGHGNSQRQLIWRVKKISGTAGINLQVSIDGATDWTTIDTYTGTADSVRTISADSASSPEAQSSSKVLSAARFIRAQDTGSGSTCWIDVVCM